MGLNCEEAMDGTPPRPDEMDFHELRSALTLARGYAQLLARRFPSPPADPALRAMNAQTLAALYRVEAAVRQLQARYNVNATEE